jgi:hypothetical protein
MTAAMLDYRGRQLTAEPSNISLLGVAHQIRDAQPVYVCLQPGDQTRYDLLIVPFSAIHGNPENARDEGLPTWDEDEPHLVVSRLVDMRPMYSAVIWRGCWDGEHRTLATYGDGRVNEWTHALLTWWFARLWELVP